MKYLSILFVAAMTIVACSPKEEAAAADYCKCEAKAKDLKDAKDDAKSKEYAESEEGKACAAVLADEEAKKNAKCEEAKKPEAKKPEAKQPEAKQPEAKQPEAKQPETEESETETPEGEK